MPGLECGLIGHTYPEMDMISFGPTIKGAHTPEEKTQNLIPLQNFGNLQLMFWEKFRKTNRKKNLRF